MSSITTRAVLSLAVGLGAAIFDVTADQFGHLAPPGLFGEASVRAVLYLLVVLITLGLLSLKSILSTFPQHQRNIAFAGAGAIFLILFAGTVFLYLNFLNDHVFDCTRIADGRSEVVVIGNELVPGGQESLEDYGHDVQRLLDVSGCRSAVTDVWTPESIRSVTHRLGYSYLLLYLFYTFAVVSFLMVSHKEDN